MKKLQVRFSFILYFLFVGSLSAQNPDWLKGLGGPDYDHGQVIKRDSLGNVYILGEFSGTVDFDPGPSTFYLTSVGFIVNFFVLKLDAGGNFTWARSVNLGGGPYGPSMDLDLAGNAFITGGFWSTVDIDPGPGTYNLTSTGNNDGFILKLNPMGNFVWVKVFQGAGETRGHFIVQESLHGNLYLTGSFNGTADFDPGPGVFTLTSMPFGQDIFIASLDRSGNFRWAKSIGGNGDDWSSSVAYDPRGKGGVYTSGSFGSTCDFDPGTGIFFLTNPSLYPSAFISKLDSSGNFVWAKAIAGSSQSNGESITIGPSGQTDVFLSGFFAGTCDFDPDTTASYVLSSAGQYDAFNARYDSAGMLKWAKHIGGLESDMIWNAVLDPVNGNVYATGNFHSTADFNPDSSLSFNLTTDSLYFSDGFVFGMDSSGNFLWAKSLGGSNEDLGQSLLVDSSATMYITGSFGSIQFTYDSLSLLNADSVSPQTSDVFLAKISLGCRLFTTLNAASCDTFVSPSGNHSWSTSGTYLDEFSGIGGCDSFLVVHLSINNPDTSITINGATLTSNEPGATYQWIDCDAGNLPVPGENGQAFTPSVNGNYAVILTQNGCYDTSACYAVTSVGLENISLAKEITVFPNPVDAILQCKSPVTIELAEIINSLGQCVFSEKTCSNELAIPCALLINGIYCLRLFTREGLIEKKICLIR